MPDDSPSEPDDVFVAGVVGASTWAKKNSNILILFGVALVVIVVSVISYVRSRERMEVAAVQQLETLQQTRVVADPAQVQTELAAYVERFDGTPYADEARMVLAEVYLESGQAGQAVDVLEDAEAGLRDPLGPQVAMLRARAYEQMERFDEAEDLYLQVADRAELAFQRREALDDAARLRMLNGNAAGAAELYRRILDGLEENAAERGVYEMRLAEAETRAQVS